METSQARQAYSHDIEDLEHDLLEMASRAESMIGASVDSLCRLDVQHARDVLDADEEIDKRDLDIETRCLRLLALQNPIAGDFRVIGTILKIITDIERVGDLAVDIAKCGLKIEKEMGGTSFIDFPRIATVARAMFREALEAFVKRDMALVAHVGRLEDQVDDLYREIREQIHERMRHTPEEVVASSWLLLALHHIERTADHAVNIAERVGFMVTGRLERLSDRSV